MQTTVKIGRRMLLLRTTMILLAASIVAGCSLAGCSTKIDKKELEAKKEEALKTAKDLKKKAEKTVDDAQKLATKTLDDAKNIVTNTVDDATQMADGVLTDMDDALTDITRKLKPPEIKILNDTTTLGRSLTNFVAYFNTYYNGERLTITAEDEFAFQGEKQRLLPRTIVVEPSTLQEDEFSADSIPAFLTSFIIPRDHLQPVLPQVDSVILKGSKVIGRYGRSNYVDGALYLMAKAFFYKSEWFQSQIKCQELVELYPYSRYSPDAHLLLAKAFMLQRRYKEGENALSKAIDISWGQKRYDILSEAFKLQADVALYFNRLDDALKPYRRAVAQSDDAVLQARWQVDVGTLLFRIGQYEGAFYELSKVPKLLASDALAMFEADLYRAAALTRLRRFEQADTILTALDKNKNYAEWKPWVIAERMNWLRLQGNTVYVDSISMVSDTVAKYREPIAVAQYQRAVQLFREGNGKQAYMVFQKSSKPETAPNNARSVRYTYLMSKLEPMAFAVATMEALRKSDSTLTARRGIDSLRAAADSSARDSLRAIARRGDSIKAKTAAEFFTMGRANELLGRPDSARVCYKYANAVSTTRDTHRARYLFAEARITGFDRKALPAQRRLADSLLKEIITQSPRSEYALEARARLGVLENAVDTALTLFAEANKLREKGDYKTARLRLALLAARFPQSALAPQSLYVAGWMSEQQNQHDTALRYYQRLVQTYPASRFAKEVETKVEFASTYWQREQARLDSIRFVDSLAQVARADSIRIARELQQEFEREKNSNKPASETKAAEITPSDGNKQSKESPPQAGQTHVVTGAANPLNQNAQTTKQETKQEAGGKQDSVLTSPPPSTPTTPQRRRSQKK